MPISGGLRLMKAMVVNVSSDRAGFSLINSSIALKVEYQQML
jgi:hypothetical protein